MTASAQTITLATPLSLRTSFRFPVQHAQARREVLVGAALLLVFPLGWLLNMGHRILMVHAMHTGRPAWPTWPAWGEWGRWAELLRHGWLTFLGMVQYHSPAVVAEALAWQLHSPALHGLAALLWLLATAAVPGYMTHYCRALDPREIFDPWRALRRVREGGRAYWHAWGIALCALACSFLGVLVGGVGFLVSSVWFWQVAGFSFATVFTQRFGLGDGAGDAGALPA
ncbi:hypothetical protein [Deinococcus multiflagellatus]|uniref:DUF4013 domain-containing protein n=1 Tax=Deinococcus multiflagellatus TaxID=1656887 RepID=A0ABW1ZFC6_9DEIO|nr:hypothetical protein [Deinococcus multiflagellatus]MBZ9712803.1 hypothetical protein [Deinococcus multiflagellatus]